MQFIQQFNYRRYWAFIQRELAVVSFKKGANGVKQLVTYYSVISLQFYFAKCKVAFFIKHFLISPSLYEGSTLMNFGFVMKDDFRFVVSILDFIGSSVCIYFIGVCLRNCLAPWLEQATAVHSLLDLTGMPIGTRGAAPLEKFQVRKKYSRGLDWSN